MMPLLVAIGWAACGALGTILTALVRYLWRLSWPFWLIAALLGMLGGTARPAQAGWIDWLTGRAEARERAAEFARHAEQNIRVAEVLRELSHERQSLATSLETLTQLSLREANWAAALTAASPLLIVATTLLLAAVVIWLVSRPVTIGGPSDSSDTLDVLIESFTTGPAAAPAIGGPSRSPPSLAAVFLPSSHNESGDSNVPHRRDQDPSEG